MQDHDHESDESGYVLDDEHDKDAQSDCDEALGDETCFDDDDTCSTIVSHSQRTSTFLKTLPQPKVAAKGPETKGIPCPPRYLATVSLHEQQVTHPVPAPRPDRSQSATNEW